MRNNDNRFFLAVLIGCLVAWIGGGVLTAQVPPPITRSVLTTNIPAFGATGQSLHRTTASPYLAWSNNYFIPITNGTGYGTTFVNQTNTTAIYFATNFTVATLPTPPAGYYAQTYAIDALTSQGVGAYVRWDGTYWKTWENVTAASEMNQFILNCRAAVINVQSPINSIYSATEGPTIVASAFPRGSTVSGTGATTSVGFSADGVYYTVSAGTTSNGIARVYSTLVNTLAGAEFVACGGHYCVSAAPDGTDNYHVIAAALDSAAGGSYPVRGSGFLYDRYNLYGHGVATTNNWICYTAHASSYTYVDSGLPVSTSTALFDRLMLITTTTNVFFYTNGVLCTSINATIPNGTTYANTTSIIKNSGTTARSLYERAPFLFFRHAARSF